MPSLLSIFTETGAGSLGMTKMIVFGIFRKSAVSPQKSYYRLSIIRYNSFCIR